MCREFPFSGYSWFLWEHFLLRKKLKQKEFLWLFIQRASVAEIFYINAANNNGNMRQNGEDASTGYSMGVFSIGFKRWKHE